MGKLDVYNLKLADSETDVIVARFYHRVSGTRVMDGKLELHEDYGEEWDRKILLRCCLEVQQSHVVCKRCLEGQGGYDCSSANHLS